MVGVGVVGAVAPVGGGGGREDNTVRKSNESISGSRTLSLSRTACRRAASSADAR